MRKLRDLHGQICARRDLLVAGLAGLVPSALPSTASGSVGADISTTIRQPDTASKEAFMQRAFEMRDSAVSKGDRPYGAVIVRAGIIIGESWSRVVLDHDPTAHAEMAAIRDAARRSKNVDLSGTIMFSSSRPCPMCEAAAYWAGIDELVHGLGITSAGRPNLCQ